MRSAQSPHVELLPPEKSVHLLGADPSVEVGVSLLGDLLNSVEVLGTGASSHHAQLLVGTPELSAINLTSHVAIILGEYHLNLTPKLLLMHGFPGSPIVGEGHRLESGLNITSTEVRSTESAVCMKVKVLKPPPYISFL